MGVGIAESGILLIVGCFWIALIIYPLIALGRIWSYSRQQVDLLREIQRQLRLGGGSQA